eukprot:1037683-Pelagomonas_calceolata.AAC.1
MLWERKYAQGFLSSNIAGPQAKEATAGPPADGGKQDGPPAAAAAANEAVEALERRVPNLRKSWVAS